MYQSIAKYMYFQNHIRTVCSKLTGKKTLEEYSLNQKFVYLQQCTQFQNYGRSKDLLPQKISINLLSKIIIKLKKNKFLVGII